MAWSNSYKSGLTTVVLEAVKDALAVQSMLYTIAAAKPPTLGLELCCSATPLPTGPGSIVEPRWDVSTYLPWVAALAVPMTTPAVDGSSLITVYALDLGVLEVVAALRQVLAGPAPVIIHDAKYKLIALWNLGIELTAHLYDTRIAATSLTLGRFHPGRVAIDADVQDKIALKSRAMDKAERALCLGGLCIQHGLGMLSGETHGKERALVAERPESHAHRQALVLHICERAEKTLSVYAVQSQEVVAKGLWNYLFEVEFPFTVANARIEWRGVTVSQEAIQSLREQAPRAITRIEEGLLKWGVAAPFGPNEFHGWLREKGLAVGLPGQRRGGYAIKDVDVKAVEHRHPAIRPYRRKVKLQRLLTEKWMTTRMTEADGRVHARHIQLGTATGRNTCNGPNWVGLGRIFRPVIVALPGRALIELDYSQVEVGIAAAEHDDPDFIQAFNTGDVYSGTAQQFYRQSLSPAELAMDTFAFKKAKPDLRENMKTVVLALLYNAQPPTLAVRLSIEEPAARAMRDQFMAMFPRIKAGLEAATEAGFATGYANIRGGLKRELPANPDPRWSVNVFRNTPIQGGAAVVFKRAVVAMDRAFRGTNTWIVLPIIDAVLIECPADQVAQVTSIAKKLMEDALRTTYPKLIPRVDVNDIDVKCWNKDGRSDSLERFLEDPTGAP